MVNTKDYPMDHPIFAGFTAGSVPASRSFFLLPHHVNAELAKPAPAPVPAKKAKPPLPYTPGPFDLGVVDHHAWDVEERVSHLTNRILTDDHLKGVDAYSAVVFRDLFYWSSVRIVESDSYPSTWDEVLHYLDDTIPGWESPKQIVCDLINNTRLNRQTSAFLEGMPNENLSILLARCRLVLRAAIAETLSPAVPAGKPANKPRKASLGRKPKSPAVPASVPIFTPDAIQRAMATVGQMDEKMRPQAQQALNSANIDGGRRTLPDVKKALGNLDQLGRNFENLVEPIRHLKTELALANAMDPDEFRISPILLLGDPGIGKTYLALQLANALGVPMEKISAGSAQGGFQITGSHPTWSRAMLGSVFQLLAEGASATPVLVIDEVDKIGTGDNCPIMPALLDLLEHNTAKDFCDQYLDLKFDASRLIVVMTANEREAIPAPLLSRAALFDVPRPLEAQRRRIIDTEIAELARKTKKRVNLDQSAADDLAARVDLDLRQTRRAVVEAFANAITEGKKIAVPKIQASSSSRRLIGFVH